MEAMKKYFYIIRNKIFPYVAYLVISGLSSTLKIKILNREIVAGLKRENKKIIYVFWHGRQFLMVYAHRNQELAVMTSLSKDGDLQTGILSKFGYHCVRGSSSRGGMQALREMVRVMRGGRDCGFAVDGPRGPVYKVKPGALFLAQLTGAVLVPVACAAGKARIFEKAWDKYVLPYPFSKAVIIYGVPIPVSRVDDLEAKALEAEKALNEFTEKAEKLLEENL